MTLTREMILAAKDIKVEAVELPSGESFIKTMTCREREALAVWVQREKERGGNFAGIHAFMACLCWCDGDGKRLFGDDEADTLGDVGFDTVKTVALAAANLNGLSEFFEADESE